MARGHFEKSQEGVKKSGYLGSNSCQWANLMNRYSRLGDIYNIKSGMQLLALNAKRAGISLLRPRIRFEYIYILRTGCELTNVGARW
jgi:hypothetical protein